MIGERSRPLRVLLFSSGNPDATFLAAGLLRGQPGKVRAVLRPGALDTAVRQTLWFHYILLSVYVGYENDDPCRAVRERP